MVSLKETRIKEREGERLYRSLRRSFTNKFGFHWTSDETSYYDGKDIFVKYDMQCDRTRTFTDAELRALRISHGFHEAGHGEFDYLQDYIDWQKQYLAHNNQEVQDNKKYPAQWLQFFGNFALDGRMERLVKIKCPAQAPLLDLNNYDWRFGMRLENLGESKTNDFRHAYGHRVLGMEDIDLWHPESIELLDSVMDEIKLLRHAKTTKECLEHVTALIIKVWPTLLEWTETDDSFDEENYGESNHTGQWSESAEQAKGAAESLLDGEEPAPITKEELEQVLKQLDKTREKEEKKVEEELAEENPKRTNKIMTPMGKESSKGSSETIHISPVSHSDKNKYMKSLAKVKRHIKPVAKELRGILEGIPEQIHRKTKTGRLMPNHVWRATHCEDNNVFAKRIKGQPKANAFIGIMKDISGSTGMSFNGSQVIDHMREGLILLLEAATLAEIPNIAFAFTEFSETVIYPLKANANKFTDINKAAIGGIEPMSGNRDTLALQYLLEQMQNSTEDIRLAIMISDGVPCFGRDENPETIKNMVKTAEKMGIEVLCLFVGEEGYALDMAKAMYPGRVMHAEKNVAKQLQTHVKRIMRLKR
ncbi:MAG: nitric oxide reductase activation protein [Psychrobacillus sp.]